MSITFTLWNILIRPYTLVGLGTLRNEFRNMTMANIG